MGWLARSTTGWSLLLGVGSLGLGAGLWLTRAPEPNHYVGSQACMVCHAEQHGPWSDSLHHKMMQRVDAPGAVRADFQSATDQLNFQRHDAQWVVGSKWEQQFMGHADGADTLLPGAWRVRLGEWALQGWDGWQVPDPLVRCHGCHTVGLDVQTGHFVEAGIGCESCHGPGSWHAEANGHMPVHRGIDSETCGQCHNRGRSTAGDYFYPVGFRPGGTLTDRFKPIEPDFIQNSSQWWGTGRERDRHQQLTAWRRGGHVNALRSLTVDYDGRFGAVTAECLTCHSAEGALADAAHPVAIDQAREGVTCAVCHNVHGELAQPRQDCTACHDNGPFHHQETTLAEHVPCPAQAQVGCVNCHMPITVQIAGSLQLHSHAPGITTPLQGAAFQSPSSCANGGCHNGTPVERLQAQFDRHYGSGGVAQESASAPNPHGPRGSNNQVKRSGTGVAL